MMSGLRYWPHRKTVSVQSTRQVQQAEKWVVDTAIWEISYGGTASWLNIPGSQEDAEDEGYEILQEVIGADLINDREKVGSLLVAQYNPATNRYENVPMPPDPRFFVAATSYTPNWTYHQEAGPTYTFYSKLDTATVIINLAKLKAAIPGVNKPDTYTFRILEPDFPGPGPKNVNNLDWRVDAAAYLTRKDFPVQDVEANGGIVAYQSPTWNTWSTDAVSGGGNINTLRATGNRVDVKVTFAKAGQPPKVEITSIGAGA
jgi:hypothetical protein